jgi:translocator protein
MKKISKKTWKRFGISFIFFQGMGLLGALFTAPAIETWYRELAKPDFTPPSWIFGPVWTILYLTLAIALTLVWNQVKKNSKAWWVLWLFLFHGILNGFWSILFFGLQSPELALINIILMLVTLVIFLFSVWKVDRRVLFLLIPYLFWISFATALNFAIVLLN